MRWSLMYSLVLEAEQLHRVARKVNVGLCWARQRQIAISICVNVVSLSRRREDI
jgi:hypothetical protein